MLRLFRRNMNDFIVVLLFGPVILIPSIESRDCEGPAECLKKLQTFSRLQSLPFTSDASKLDQLCNDLTGGYNCSAKLAMTSNCLTDEEKFMMSVTTSMAQLSFLMFCNQQDIKASYFRTEMLQYSDCILKQKSAFDCCVQQSKVPDIPMMQVFDKSSKSTAEKQFQVCCPLMNNLRCAETVVADNCGADAANFTAEYIRRAAGEPVQGLCQDIHNYPTPDPEYCKVPVPVCTGCKAATSVLLTALMTLLLMLWIKV